MSQRFTTIAAGYLADRDQVLLVRGHVATIAKIEPRDDGRLILHYECGRFTVIDDDTPVAVAVEPVTSVRTSTKTTTEQTKTDGEPQRSLVPTP